MKVAEQRKAESQLHVQKQPAGHIRRGLCIFKRLFSPYLVFCIHLIMFSFFSSVLALKIAYIRACFRRACMVQERVSTMGGGEIREHPSRLILLSFCFSPSALLFRLHSNVTCSSRKMMHRHKYINTHYHVCRLCNVYLAFKIKVM